MTRGGGSGETDYVDLILRTYQEEMAGLTSDVMEQQNPIAQIQFMTDVQVQAEKSKEKDGYSWRYNNVTDRGYYPVYPSFQKTIGLLEDCGIRLTTVTDAGEVIRADIDLFQLTKKDDSRYYDKDITSQIIITDKEELAALMETARLDDYSNMNPFCERDDRITFEAVVKSSSGQISHEYSIRRADLPEFLKADSERINLEVETVSD